MRFHLAIIEKHLSQCLVLGDAQYIFTIINETIYYYDYSESQRLPFISNFSTSPGNLEKALLSNNGSNHRCLENDYEVLSSLSSASPSPKWGVLLGPQTQLFTILNSHLTIGCKGPLFFCIFWKELYYKQINVPNLLSNPPMQEAVHLFNKLFITVLLSAKLRAT